MIAIDSSGISPLRHEKDDIVSHNLTEHFLIRARTLEKYVIESLLHVHFGNVNEVLRVARDHKCFFELFLSDEVPVFLKIPRIRNIFFEEYRQEGQPLWLTRFQCRGFRPCIGAVDEYRSWEVIR